MVYRIRHHGATQSKTQETVIEAHSPAEAMVKFQATQGGDASRREVVTSVCAEESSLVLQW